MHARSKPKPRPPPAPEVKQNKHRISKGIRVAGLAGDIGFAAQTVGAGISAVKEGFKGLFHHKDKSASSQPVSNGFDGQGQGVDSDGSFDDGSGFQRRSEPAESCVSGRGTSGVRAFARCVGKLDQLD